MSNLLNVQPIVARCPHCGSQSLVRYRREWAKPGDWNYSWEEGVQCDNCGRTRIAVPSTADSSVP